MYIEWSAVATTDEPVSVATFKEHARVASSTEDTLIASLISAAREYVEREVSGGFLLAPRAAVINLTHFPLNNGSIELPAPIQASTDVSVGYVDQAGSTQSLTLNTDFIVSAPTNGPGRVYPVSAWPDTQELESGWWRPDAVQINLIAGSTLVSDMAKQAIKLVAADWYENREDTGQGVSPEIANGLQRIAGKMNWGFYA